MIVYCRSVRSYSNGDKFVLCRSGIAQVNVKHGLYIDVTNRSIDLKNYKFIYSGSPEYVADRYLKEDMDNNYHPELLKIMKWEF